MNSDNSAKYYSLFYGRILALITGAYISNIKGVKLNKANTICLGKNSKDVGLEPKDCTKEYLLPRQ